MSLAALAGPSALIAAVAPAGGVAGAGEAHAA